MKQMRSFFFLFLGILIFSACSVRKQRTADEGAHVIMPKSETFAMPIVASWKISADLTALYQGSSMSLSADVSLVVGQGIYASLRPFVLYELARVYLLPNEVVVIDKHNGAYVRVTYEQLNASLRHKLPIRLSYAMLEGLLLGYVPQDLQMEKGSSAQQYVATLPQSAIQLNYMMGNNLRPTQLESAPAHEGYVLRASYGQYTTPEEGAFPRSSSYQLFSGGKKEFSIEVQGRSYARSERVRQQLEVVIPSRYKAISLENLFQ